MSTSPDPSSNEPQSGPLRFRVIGLGGAGSNVVEHLARTGAPGLDCVAVNTESVALARIKVAKKFLLGQEALRGLSAGGDPEVGAAAAQADLEKLRPLVAETDIVFIIAGMGGGTGTGAAPILAKAAKEAGALVLGIALLPFDFEGSRRQRQAALGLRDFRTTADVVLGLPNQKTFFLLSEGKAALGDTFAVANDIAADGVRGLWRMLSQPALISLDFGTLQAAMKEKHWDACFAFADSFATDRAERVAEKLLRHPLLEKGTLSHAETVIISIAGGPDLGREELAVFMEKMRGQCRRAHILFGASITEAFKSKFAATMIVAGAGVLGDVEVPAEAEVPNTPRFSADLDTEFHKQPTPRPRTRIKAPMPELSADSKNQILEKHLTRNSRSRKKNAASSGQGQLPLEVISKGRFENSEPTIHGGEDLDLPTYLRRNVPMN